MNGNLYRPTGHEAEVHSRFHYTKLADLPADWTRVEVGEYAFVKIPDDYVVLVFRHGWLAYVDGRNAFNALLRAVQGAKQCGVCGGTLSCEPCSEEGA